MKKMYGGDIVEKFWKKYIKADSFERREILKKNVLLVFKPFIDGTILNIKEEHLREHALLTSLEGYFDDLIGVAYKLGHDKALDNAGVLHGKDAERFLKRMKDAEDGKISPKQRKFLDECAETFRKLEGNKERLKE